MGAMTWIRKTGEFVPERFRPPSDLAPEAFRSIHAADLHSAHCRPARYTSHVAMASTGTSKMIAALALLLVFQLVGEIIARGLGLPVPGPVIGMALLFAALAVRKGPSDELRSTAQGLLQHLSLLFVPAGTGVMLHFARVSEEWLALLVSLVVSTGITIAVTALLLHLFIRRSRFSKAAR
jgi:holin-like protein